MSGKKILVADDDPLIVELLVKRLIAAGFEVSSAKNGEEAVAKAKGEKPLAIIMDVIMPIMSGFEAMQKLRDIRETRDIPAIIISAKMGMKDFFEDMHSVEFMHKPIDFDVLISRLMVLIGGAEQNVPLQKRVVLSGVEDLLISKIRTSLRALNLEVSTALTESAAVLLIKKIRPTMVLCQFWEDEHIFSPREIAQQLLSHSAVSGTPFYVFCKDALSLEARKHFRTDRILTFKETSDLLRKLESLIEK